jgi:hypothetical protein
MHGHVDRGLRIIEVNYIEKRPGRLGHALLDNGILCLTGHRDA